MLFLFFELSSFKLLLFIFTILADFKLKCFWSNCNLNFPTALISIFCASGFEFKLAPIFPKLNCLFFSFIKHLL